MGTIEFDTANQIISMQGLHSSYVIQLYSHTLPLHLYWGPHQKLADTRQFSPSAEPGYSIKVKDRDTSYFIEEFGCEYGFAENGDYRVPAFGVRDSRGYPVTGPFELDVNIYRGKHKIPGLPSARTGSDEDIQTLELRMVDHPSGLLTVLSYTMFPEHDAVTRNVIFHNRGNAALRLEKAASVSMDMPNRDYELLYLHGAWARERQIIRRTLQPGTFSFGSTRGISSHQFSPSFALLEAETSEFRGDAYGYGLIYSGNFLAEIELNYGGNLRVNMGLNPDTFEWELEPGGSFYTPEAVMVYADDGLNGMSRRFHRFFQERIVPSRFAEMERPVLFNSWEASYFDFDESTLKELADTAVDLGIELFVLDDGWFEGRDSDRTSLGDWQADRRKLPGGLKSFGESLQHRGLKFGLWIEPEMISYASKLYHKHPDWILAIPDRPAAEGRNQLVLDLSRPDVCDFIIDTVNGLLNSAPISYVKWDMNRSLTNAAARHLSASRQREIYHRYVLGLYRVLDEITRLHPDVLFEGCAGGGGRFDPGILYYMPQYWTSDNTDAVSRVRIQYGTSLFFPPISMGAHVSAVPNHQTGRTTSLEMRGQVAMSGNLGYELDLSRLSADELDSVRDQVRFYKQYRSLIQFGRFLRLVSPFDSTDAAWMFIHPEIDDILVFWFRLYGEANRPVSGPRLVRLRLAELDPFDYYRERERRIEYTGSELMNTGLILSPSRLDYDSRLIILERIR